MDSPISGNSSFSQNAMSPVLRSPLPIRTPTMLSKKNLDSIPFLDLLDDGELGLQKIHRTQSYVMEKIHRLTVDDMEFLE